jgi:hypothetical protein
VLTKQDPPLPLVPSVADCATLADICHALDSWFPDREHNATFGATNVDFWSDEDEYQLLATMHEVFEDAPANHAECNAGLKRAGEMVDDLAKKLEEASAEIAELEGEQERYRVEFRKRVRIVTTAMEITEEARNRGKSMANIDRLTEAVDDFVASETGVPAAECDPDDEGCAGCLSASDEHPCLTHGCTSWCREHYKIYDECADCGGSTAPGTPDPHVCSIDAEHGGGE